MKFKNLSIIGGGPNAVYALDILLKKILKKNIKAKKKIIIFEQSGLFGCGKTHSKELSNDILLNRVAGQISLGSYPFLKFPKKLSKYDYNFMNWKSKNKDYFVRKLKPSDWPPRQIFGQAMVEKFYDLLKIYKNFTNINIILCFDKVVEIKKKSSKFEIKTKSKEIYFSDKILVATGNYISEKVSSKILKIQNSKQNNTPSIVENNFLQKLDNNEYWKNIFSSNIVIFGTGVSSLDVIEKLRHNKNILYPISRTFLFPFARPKNQKLKNIKKLEHAPIVLNDFLINKLKIYINKKKNFNKLNFNSCIYPILKAEFYLIYFKSYLKKNSYKDLLDFTKKNIKIYLNKKNYNFNNFENQINNLLKNFLIENKFHQNFFKDNWFSQKKIIDNIIKNKYCFFDFFSNPLLLEDKNFQKRYLQFLKWDIKEAEKGNLSSPFKKASDGLWRDLRQQITILFDNCSNLKLFKYFLNNILTIHNRMCDGPSLDVIKKIKYLIEKKIIFMNHKKNYKITKARTSIFLEFENKRIKLDKIFVAIASIYKDNYKKDILISQMKKNGLVEENSINGASIGLKLNKYQSPIFKNKVDKNIRFVGPASEGSKFFHHTLSRPDKKQFNFMDLNNWSENL